MTSKVSSMLSLAVLALAGSGGVVSAAVIANPSKFSYYTPQSSYTLAVGESVVVPVYLRETVAPGGTSVLASQQGLAVGTFQSRALDEFLPAQVTAVAPAAGFQTASYTIPFPSYYVTYPLVSPDPATTTPAPTDGVLPTQFVTGSNEYYVLLQNMTFTGSQPGQVTYSFEVPDAGPISSTFVISYVFGINSPLDPIAPTSVTFNVAVPEPSGLGVLGVAGGLLARRRRK